MSQTPTQRAPRVDRAPATSEPIKLGTGVLLGGKLADTAVVRILTRGDYRAATAKTDPEEKRNFLTARAIVKLGEETNQGAIEAAIDSLTETDEQIISIAVEKLKLEAMKRSGVIEEQEPFIPVCDLWSEPLELNPGIVVNGERLTTCRVRLLTKGQWNAAQNAGGEIERTDKILFFSIASLGRYTEIQPEWIDYLTDPDIDRIQEATEALRAQARAALGSKSSNESIPE